MGIIFSKRPKLCFLASIEVGGLPNFCVIYESYEI